MRTRRNIGERFFGDGLVIALLLTLVVASALSMFGIYLEVTGSTVTIVSARKPTVIVNQMTADAPAADHPRADDAAGAAQITDPGAVQAASPPPKPQAVPSPDPGQGQDERPPDNSQVTSAAAPDVRPTDQTGQAARKPAPIRPTPGPRGAPRPSADVPIVMYHHVGSLPPDADIFRRDLTVSPELFEQTLARLAEQEVHTVTMAELFEHFAGGPALPERAVILTFDDGYDDNYDHAFRLLREHDMVGTFFITTDFVGRPGYVTWEQVMEMAAAGMEIAAHSADHADFTKIGPNELKRQLVEPKAILEYHIGQPVRFLAYPAGKHNPAVIAATRAAGYEAAVTVIHGTRHTPGMAHELRRVRARGADTVTEIMARMTPPSWRR